MPTSRRDFLRKGTLAAAALPAVGLLAACSDSRAAAQPPAASPAPPPPVKTAREKAEEMDAMHEERMKAFPAQTRGKGNQPLVPRLESGVKVFDLTAEEIQWEVEPGRMVAAWAYNGQVPGPMIRVREGERVRIRLTNHLKQSTSIHFHGLEVPNDQDGVTYITQKPIKPGDTYVYQFTVPNSGSHMYHSHHNSTTQVSLGLLGAFIVDPRNSSTEPRADLDHTLILNDGPHGFTLNGKSFPATEPITMKLGQTLRLRFMNEGMMIHPMHLHGAHMTVIAKDGWPQPAPWKCDTLNVAPGERWDVLVKPRNPGTWAFHCHILPHAESEHGMFGMVTALIVES
ncbi:MAG TPA: multicopper oxidase domain-containing protein [Gemmatimonadales bacterium]|nr:multicopper oxidase domain-containing protein [Gemmatimonadales bacterium]